MTTPRRIVLPVFVTLLSHGLVAQGRPSEKRTPKALEKQSCEEYASAWAHGSRQGHLKACQDGLEGPGRNAEIVERAAADAAEKARQQRWADMTDDERAAFLAQERKDAAAKERAAAASRRRKAERKAAAAARADCMAKLPNVPNAPIGYTAEQVRCLFGSPRNINKTVSAAGQHEQWIYPGRYIYVVNGIVTSYQMQQ